MKRFHHFLHFPDTSGRLGRIGGIRPVRDIIVKRIIAPVILTGLEVCLIHTVIVIGWENVHMSHTKLLEMVYAGSLSCGIGRAGLGQCQELTLVHNPRRRVDGEVAMMHLIYHSIVYML